MSIIIGGDIVPTLTNYNLFENSDIDSLLGKELKNALHSADYCIANLETPITDVKMPISKCGPLHAVPSSVSIGLKMMGINLVGLANNHINDQGRVGISNTIAALDSIDIKHVGAGMNLHEAEEPIIFLFNNKTVGIYACAEHEFSIANEFEPGANPFDPLESMDHVMQLSKKCDFLIVLYHGGKEYYRYPSPFLQKVCRKFIDKGADLVICQHSHCIGCEEKYLNGTIVYGQGNFLFDDGDNEFVNSGLLVLIDDEFNISYKPIYKDLASVRFAIGREFDEIMSGFYQRSEEIKVSGFISKKYQEFADSMRDYYLLALNGRESFLFKAINKISFGKLRTLRIKKKYNIASLLRVENYIKCESHRELLLNSLHSIEE